MSSPRKTLADLSATQTRAGFARFALNWLPVVVQVYHPPEVIDGTPFPASVTVHSLLDYVRVVLAPEDGGLSVRLNLGETKLTGEDADVWRNLAGDRSGRATVISRVYDPVRVPFLCAGSSELSLITDPRVGDVGILQLAGRSIADALAAGQSPAPAQPTTVIPEFMPNPMRLSDGCYMGTILPGAPAVPPEIGPAENTSQLGPRDARASTVYLRLNADAWELAGTAIKLGASATKGVARLNDPVLPGAGWTAWLTASFTTIGAALIPPIVIPPQPAFDGKITGASGTVTCMD